MANPYSYGGYGSPYSGGYGEYGVNVPRTVEVPVPVPVPFPMKGMVTDPGISGRNVDLNKATPKDAVEVDGKYVSEDRWVGIPRVLAGLADAGLGLLGIRTDFDEQGTRRKGEVSVAGYGGIADGTVDPVRPRGSSPNQPVNPYLDPKWIASRDNYMNMLQDRDMRRSLDYYDMYADRANRNNLRNLASTTPWVKDAAYFNQALPSNVENLAASAQRRYLNAALAKRELAEAAAIPAREAIKAALMGRFQPGNVAPATIANPGSYSV